jgi:hypothetical protein
MSTPNATGRHELEPWQVGDLRLTAFPSLALTGARPEGKRWEALVGKKPENASRRNYDTEVEENGPFVPGGRLTYRRSPQGIIQWMLERIPDPDKPGMCPWMSPQFIKPFKELMCSWLLDCPPLRRLAFGAALYLPVATREEGYRRLKKYLPFKRDNSSQAGDFLEYSPQTGDFLYQFNRRRVSHSARGVEINRLSKWAWVPLGEVRAVNGKLVDPAESACLLELDINTAPEFQGALPHDQYVPLLEEMVGLAVEIAARGDVL